MLGWHNISEKRASLLSSSSSFDCAAEHDVAAFIRSIPLSMSEAFRVSFFFFVAQNFSFKYFLCLCCEYINTSIHRRIYSIIKVFQSCAAARVYALRVTRRMKREKTVGQGRRRRSDCSGALINVLIRVSARWMERRRERWKDDNKKSPASPYIEHYTLSAMAASIPFYVLVRIRMTIHSRTKYFCRFRSACLFVGDDEHTPQNQQRQCVCVCDADAAKWRNCDRCRPIPKLLIIWFVYQFIFSVRRMCRMYVVYATEQSTLWAKVRASERGKNRMNKDDEEKEEEKAKTNDFFLFCFDNFHTDSVSLCVWCRMFARMSVW